MALSKTVCTGLVPWLLLLLMVGGCADRSQQRCPLPQLETPPDFTEIGTATTPQRWWTAFADPNLDFQVNRGLCNNYSIKAAAHRVLAARAVTRREASDFWPDIDGILGLGFDGGPFENSESYNLGLDADWQVDLWGEIESRVEAQRLRADVSSWNYHSIVLGLSGEITSLWFSLIEANAQAELLKVQIKTNETGLELQEKRFGLGFVRSADVLRQRQLLESTLEQAVFAESQIRVLEHQLAVLLGELPQSAKYETGTSFPQLPPLPATGFPSELLLRRPDIQENYTALLAADQDLAVAISQQFPRLNLSGSLQNAAENPGDLFRDWFISISGQLIAPLFDGGERRAEVERTQAVKLELFHEYAQSVLLAYQQVEDALAQEKYQLQSIEHLEEQVKLAGQASNQLREQYLIGDAQYLDVLNSITGQQQLQRDLLGAQLDLRLIRVSLYLALAGNIDPVCLPQGFNQAELLPSSLANVAEEESIDEEDVQLDESVGADEPDAARPSPEDPDALSEKASQMKEHKMKGNKTDVDKAAVDKAAVDKMDLDELVPNAKATERSLLDRLRGTNDE